MTATAAARILEIMLIFTDLLSPKSVKIRAEISVIRVQIHPKTYLTKKAALAIMSFPPYQKPLKMGLSSK